MKYLSLFSGIGGFELGIKQAYEDISNSKRKQQRWSTQDRTDNEQSFLGKEQPTCIGFSEIDKYAIQIYQKHFPNHKNYGDITKINVQELPDFDLLVGGFPCQAFSIAGKRRGFDDTRGTLFFDIARILKEKRPRNFILENVKGLLSHDNGRTFKTIISTLAELGYCVEWQVLNAKNFGVPQNRERVFIVGHLGGIPERKVFPIGESTGAVIKKLGNVYESNSENGDVLDVNGISKTLKSGVTDNPKHGGIGSSNSPKILQLNKPKHSNDRIYGTDGISPTLNTAQGGNRQPFIKIPEATKKGYAEATTGQSINLSVPNSKTRRGRVSDIAQTIDTGMHQHTLTADMKIRRLTPLECERLMGYPDGWTEGLSDTQRYKTLGNGIVSNVVEEVVKRLL